MQVSLADLDLEFQQRRAERLSVRVERQRGGDAARKRPLADELQREEMRQLESADFAQDDPGEMPLDRASRHALDEERVVLGPIGDEREDRSVALVARAAVRQLVEPHGLLSNTVTRAAARS